MVNEKKAYFVSKYAFTFAMIFVAMMLDKVISFGLPTGISTAVCVLTVTFSFCLVDNSWASGVLAGTFFGLSSLVKAFAFGETFNINPLVSVLPRVAVGAVTFAVYRLMLKLTSFFQPKKRQILSVCVAVLCGLVTNTVLYLTALNWYKDFLGAEYQSLFEIIKVVVFTNIIPEYLVSLVAVPFVVLGVRRGLKMSIDGKKIQEETAK